MSTRPKDLPLSVQFDGLMIAYPFWFRHLYIAFLRISTCSSDISGYLTFTSKVPLFNFLTPQSKTSFFLSFDYIGVSHAVVFLNALYYRVIIINIRTVFGDDTYGDTGANKQNSRQY